MKIFLWARGNPTNRIPESADKNKDKLPEKISEEKSEEPSEKTEKTEKTDFEMLEKSESLFDQVKESMPEEEWLVLYMKGRGSRTSSMYAWGPWSGLGWFTAYLANVFLTKLHDPILPRQSCDRTNPDHAF